MKRIITVDSLVDLIDTTMRIIYWSREESSLKKRIIFWANGGAKKVQNRCYANWIYNEFSIICIGYTIQFALLHSIRGDRWGEVSTEWWLVRWEKHRISYKSQLASSIFLILKLSWRVIKWYLKRAILRLKCLAHLLLSCVNCGCYF